MTGLPQRLIFVRHGHYEGSTVPRSERDNKPLVPRGVEQAKAAGRWLAERGIRPDLVVTTRTRRTVQTGDLLLEELGPPSPARLPVPHGYGPRTVIEDRLAQWIGERDIETLLFVGHETSQATTLSFANGKELGLDDESHACVVVCALEDGGWRVVDHHPGG
jgi:phosphohistidine phosphatase SixA